MQSTCPPRARATRRKSSSPSCGLGSPRSADRSPISAISGRNSSSAGAGSTRRLTPISSRSASSCRVRRAARSASASACPAPGLAGALAAWTGFTLPSAIALVLFALGVEHLGSVDAAWLHGLKIAAVAVVAQAVWGMASTMATGKTRATLAVAAAALVLAVPTTAGQLGAIALGALAGIVLLRSDRAAGAGIPRRRDPPWLCNRVPRRVLRAAARAAARIGSLSQPGAGAVQRLLSRGLAGVRRRPCGAAAAPGRRGAAGLGRATTPSLPATARRRRCRGRCSPSPPISAR